MPESGPQKGPDRALSPVRIARTLTIEPLRRTLSPIASASATVKGTTQDALSKSLYLVKRRTRKESDASADDDFAKPAYMAKSFVSMLTTASMYNGNVSDLANEEVFDMNVEEDESDEGDETLEHDSNDNSINDTLKKSMLHERPGSVFELSIVEKLNSKGSTQDLRTRARNLSEKLRGTFGIQDDDIFLAEYSCWLLKDVLLQGHIYLTQSHLLFLAFLPKYDKDKNTLTGSLAMETLPPRMSRYWAVLKNHTLSLYNKSTDLYFPVLTIDLRYAVRAEVLHDSSKNNWFRILTEKRNYRFQADSSHIARSWVGMLKKHIFTIRNKGDCVTVKIPLENVIDARETEIIDSAETIRVKVLEGNGSFAYDDYIFTFFTSGPDAFRSITEAIDNLKESEEISSMGILSDSTARLKVIEETRRSVNPLRFFRSKIGPSCPLSPVSPIFSEAAQLPELPPQEPVVEQYLTREDDVEVIPDDISDDSPDEINTGDVMEELPSDYSGIDPLSIKNKSTAKSTLSKWTPKIIKSASSMWISNPVHYSEKNSLEWGSEDEYLATEEERVIMTKRFQSHFSLSESDMLIATYYAYLHRNIPMYGKVYLGEKEICFRSLVPGFHTKMILPYKDIENCYKEKGFKFGYHGLVIVIHGHEELFLEFSSSAARDDCEYLLLKQLEIMSSASSAQGSDNQMTTSQNLEAAKIKFFEDKIHSEAGVEVPIIIEDHPILKTNIKPGKSYKFTLMTIGSRGDVQPYIALGLGLKADGHEVKIATHKEFGDWITGHGLGFSEIAGNPTELMALMVSHGSMNVGLVREASGKFRGWISELLETSWKACQGTEILIESPSTMAGIHIAEALGIPYFRAFTMPWTRTRAYPHAFIVPDEKKGGSYNYLTHVLFENVFWRGISGQVNKWRQETLHLPKTNLDRLKQNNVPFMYNVSPTVLPPPVDFSDWVKVTGYWFLNEASTYEPSNDLLEFIKKAKEDRKKLVYIGFGSIVVSNPKEMTQAIVDSVIEADVRCILNKGWSERLGGPSKVEIELPPEIYNAGSLPHDWLFPQIDAAVHHGGSGTTGATLKAGLPTVIKPFFGDQFFYANRVEDIGAGIGLKELNVKSMSKALKTATTDQRMITKAKAIGERIQKENGVQEAINVLYREVEYARGLILAKRRADGLTEHHKEEEIGEIPDQTSDESGSDSWYLVE